MNAVPRRYLVASALIVLALPAAWYFFPRKPFDVGMELMRQGRRVEALKVWEKACGDGDIDSCAQAVILRVSRGDIDAGRKLLADAKQKAPTHVWVMLLEGSFLELDGKTAEAKALYEEAERTHPTSGLPATSLAKLALAQEDYAEAERCTERAIAAEPGLGSAHAMHARVLVATSSLDQALASYSEAMQLGGMSEVDWVSLADAAAMRGATSQERLSILEDGARLHPDSPVILLPLGVARADNGQVRAGIEALRVACDVAADDAQPRIVLGMMFLEMGNAGFAVPRLEEALKIEPRNVDAAHFLAAAWATMEEREKALGKIAEILARTDIAQQDRVRSLFLRASLQHQAGKIELAMEDVKALLALEPEMPEANWLGGRIELEAGHLPEARVMLERSVKAHPALIVMQDLARLGAREEKIEDALNWLETLQHQGAFSVDWIKSNPEFRVLERNEKFRLMMEGATSTPSPTPPDVGP